MKWVRVPARELWNEAGPCRWTSLTEEQAKQVVALVELVERKTMTRVAAKVLEHAKRKKTTQE